jgi:SAM-dependent methyltransferase
MSEREDHWNAVYGARAEAALTWFEDAPEMSIDLIRSAGVTADARVIDVGGGASRLVDALLDDGFSQITVLDLSAQALRVSQERLGKRAGRVHWVAGDITLWLPDGAYDLWHDRAVFHFLTDPEDRAAYLRALRQALRPGGVAVIGTFALDGPETCSGLPVVRYAPETLAQVFGDGFEPVSSRAHRHRTPMGRTQSFVFCTFRRR